MTEQAIFNSLDNVYDCIIKIQELCDGAQTAIREMSVSESAAQLGAGACGAIEIITDRLSEELETVIIEYRNTHNVKHLYEMTDTERTAYIKNEREGQNNGI